MKQSKINVLPKYKWKDITTDLQDFFIKRAFICGIVLIAAIVSIFTIKVKAVTIFIFLGFGFCLLSAAYYLLSVLYGQVSYYIGVVEKHSGKDYTPRNPITRKQFDKKIFGRSSILMAVTKKNEDGTEDVAKFEVPVGYAFDVSEGNQLIVYALKNSVFKKNANTFTVTNPILVKVYSE